MSISHRQECVSQKKASEKVCSSNANANLLNDAVALLFVRLVVALAFGNIIRIPIIVIDISLYLVFGVVGKFIKRSVLHAMQ